jgi:hypothetical protein
MTPHCRSLACRGQASKSVPLVYAPMMDREYLPHPTHPSSVFDILNGRFE